MIFETIKVREHKVSHILILIPGGQGGINRLFTSLFAVSPLGNLKLTPFYSRSDGNLDFFKLPIRLFIFLRYIVSRQVSLVHINLSSRGSTYRKYLFALFCRLARKPYLIHLHSGGFVDFHEKSGWLVKRIIASMFYHAARVIVLGEYWRNFVSVSLNVPDDRISVLHNAVKKVEFSFESEEPYAPVILFLGRVGHGKGVPELVNALGNEALRGLNWRAVLAGDGDIEPYLQAIDRQGLSGRVDFPGWVDSTEVEALLSQADILVLPSHAENLPLSMLEGMGAGLAVIATPVGAIPEVIRDGENGLLVPVGDSAALASALARVVKSSDLRERLGMKAREDFDKSYDISTYRAKLESVYISVLDQIHSESST